MDFKKLAEWGGLAIVGILLLRYLANMFTGGGSGLVQTWNPNIQPTQLGGGLLYMYPTMVYPNYPNRGGRNRGEGGWRAGQPGRPDRPIAY